jgi:pyridinium-3,5-biscarboxylic acid mononucleotide sulfurtransferase
MIDYQIFETSPKLLLLKNILVPLLEEGLIVAFSGGVDSGFLLWSAVATLNSIRDNGNQGRLLALLAMSPSLPSWEIQAAKKFAASLNVELSIINSHELKQEAYAKNDGTRCYYCKSELFKIAKLEAEQKSYHHIAYGYNASDRHDVRFGHVAAKENNIHAPLDKAGIEKLEIRNALRQMGSDLADKPASPCLASRIMTGVHVTEKKLRHVEKMENTLRQAGLHVFRVRLHEEKFSYFRIEVMPEEMLAVLKLREILIHEAQQMGYQWVNLDLSGYRLGGGTLL